MNTRVTENKKEYGRTKLFLIGMVSTVLVVAAIQIVAVVNQVSSLFGLNAYIIEGILMFYTIVIYSATLGPTLYYFSVCISCKITPLKV